MTDNPNRWEGLIPEDEAADLLSLSVSTLRKYRLTGNGPKFIRISPRCIRYRKSWLENWSNARAYDSTSGYPEPDAPAAH